MFDFLQNPKKGNFYLLEIRDGKVQMKIKNNKRENKGLVDIKINDGNWHNVAVTYAKKKKSLSIIVDRTSEKTIRVQKSRINREFFIGGLPDNITDLKKLVCIFKVASFALDVINVHISGRNFRTKPIQGLHQITKD